MRLLVVGSAAGMASPDKSHSCYLIETAYRRYMFDCGDGSASALLRCRVDTSSITNVFISHTHADHICGLPMFIQTEHLRSRRELLTIHIPSEFERAFRVMMDAFYLFGDKLGFETPVRPIDNGFFFDDGALQVKAHANSHLFGNREILSSYDLDNRMQCFSFVVKGGNRKLVYSSDLGGLCDLDAIVRDADLLLTEGMHIDLCLLPEFLIENGVKRCVLTHLPDHFDHGRIRLMFSKSGYDNLDFAREGWAAQV